MKKMIKKLLRNKKADLISFNILFHILEIVFIITVGVFVFFIVHVEKNINTFPIESEVLFSRILYSNNGLWVYDSEIDRLYPGILDSKNVNDISKIENSLNKSIWYGKENTRAAVELIIEGQDGIRYGPIYYDKQKYEEWVEWYKAKATKGIGTRSGQTKSVNILIKKGDLLVPGILSATILIPNA